MMATVRYVTSGLGLRKFQADGFLLTRVYMEGVSSFVSSAAVLKLTSVIKKQITFYSKRLTTAVCEFQD